MKTQDWIPQQTPIALLIGHDPRLQASETIASYALFADYYNRNNSGSASERKKQGLAQCSFEQISYLTNNQIRPEQLYITNLCNESLPLSPPLLPKKEDRGFFAGISVGLVYPFRRWNRHVTPGIVPCAEPTQNPLGDRWIRK